MICERLTSGRLTGIDRSAAMVAAASKRNAAAIEAGLAEFLVGNLEGVDLGDRRFDKILAARIGLFQREPERAHALASRWLASRAGFLVLRRSQTFVARTPLRRGGSDGVA